jgi:hypothetical protein
VTTVGCGDRFPVSTGGRLIAVALMIVGVGLFGTLTGIVAKWFLAPGEEAQDESWRRFSTSWKRCASYWRCERSTLRIHRGRKQSARNQCPRIENADSPSSAARPPQLSPLLIETTQFDRFRRKNSMKSTPAPPCQRGGGAVADEATASASDGSSPVSCSSFSKRPRSPGSGAPFFAASSRMPGAICP